MTEQRPRFTALDGATLKILVATDDAGDNYVSPDALKLARLVLLESLYPVKSRPQAERMRAVLCALAILESDDAEDDARELARLVAEEFEETIKPKE